ncbi:MAG: methyl-accepting chemotaxis protein [Candidatus Nitrosopumilus sp. bin_68KS]
MSTSQNIVTEEIEDAKDNFFKQVVDQTTDIGNEISRALKSTKEITRRASMLSTTAKIEANRAGDAGRNFLVVSESIDELSRKTDDVLNKMEKETVQEIEDISKVIKTKSISIQGNRLANLALTNIRIVDRNLFERAADVRWWATDDILVNALLEENNSQSNEAKHRLGVILKSYTVYYDLVLCNTNGLCIASAEDKFRLTGRNFSDKPWFTSAMNTKNGEDFGFDTVHKSPAINDDFTLVYSCKVHEDGDPDKRVIGVIGAVFKWKEFIQRIVRETPLLPEEIEKTRILICDDDGNVIADTKDRILQQNIQFTGRDELFKKEKGFEIVEKNWHKKLVCHALSPGFEGYQSEKWHSLIIQDMDDDSQIHNFTNNNNESLETVIELISNLSEETKKAICEIEKINDDTHVLSLNAAIESAKVGDAGRGFGVISTFMGDLSKTTSKITSMMDSNTEKKLSELYSFISLNSKIIRGNRLANLSFTNIDLIDRALYERTADVRWWSTESSIIQALNEKTNHSKDFLASRLATILKFYTVYDNLIVCDTSGNVVAKGSSNDVAKGNVKDALWFQNMLKNNEKEYGFDIIHNTQASGISTNLVFSSKIHKNGDVSDKVIGILGIVFGWERFTKTIFDQTPLRENEINSTDLLILDSNGNTLSENKKIKDFTFENDLLSSIDGAKNYQIIPSGNSEVILSNCKSKGYEGFSTGWHSVIIQSIQ